jgi:hypothetical protein
MGKSKNLILVGDIPLKANETDMRNVFSAYGQIKEIYFKDFPDLTTYKFSTLFKKGGYASPQKESIGPKKPKKPLGHYCLIAYQRKESVEKCIYSNVMFHSKALLLMKVVEEEMFFLLKDRKHKKKGLSEFAMEDMEVNEDDEVAQYMKQQAEEKMSKERKEDNIDRLCQHVFISYKLKQDKITLKLIDYFFEMMRTIDPIEWTIENNQDAQQVTENLDRKVRQKINQKHRISNLSF